MKPTFGVHRLRRLDGYFSYLDICRYRACMYEGGGLLIRAAAFLKGFTNVWDEKCGIC